MESRKKEISSLWSHWEERQRDPVTPQSRLHLQGPEVTLNRQSRIYTSKWSWPGCGPVHHSLIDWASVSSYGGWSNKLSELWTLLPRADLFAARDSEGNFFLFGVHCSYSLIEIQACYNPPLFVLAPPSWHGISLYLQQYNKQNASKGQAWNTVSAGGLG